MNGKEHRTQKSSDIFFGELPNEIKQQQRIQEVQQQAYEMKPGCAVAEEIKFNSKSLRDKYMTGESTSVDSSSSQHGMGGNKSKISGNPSIKSSAGKEDSRKCSGDCVIF